MVYIQEAHASDMWQMQSNVRDKVVFQLPRSYGERGEIASACVRKLGLQMPALIDGIDDAVERAYTAWPDRLYLIGKDGRVVFKSGPGPFGFEPEQLQAALSQQQF